MPAVATAEERRPVTAVLGRRRGSRASGRGRAARSSYVLGFACGQPFLSLPDVVGCAPWQSSVPPVFGSNDQHAAGELTGRLCSRAIRMVEFGPAPCKIKSGGRSIASRPHLQTVRRKARPKKDPRGGGSQAKGMHLRISFRLACRKLQVERLAAAGYRRMARKGTFCDSWAMPQSGPAARAGWGAGVPVATSGFSWGGKSAMTTALHGRGEAG